MKKRVLSFMLVLSMIASIIMAVPITANAMSEKDVITSREYLCTWAFYISNGTWYISSLNSSGKQDVLSLGRLNPNVEWLEAGLNSAKINSNMTKITIDNGLSQDRNIYVYDRGNDKPATYPEIINDRRYIEGKTVDLEWYFFEADNSTWYIVNEEGTVARLTTDFSWPDVDMGDYMPEFSIRNNQMYVSFEEETQAPSYNIGGKPQLVGYTSLPSQIPQGEAYYIDGKIISDTPITKVTVKIFSRNDNAQSLNVSESVYPYTTTYDLDDIDKKLHFTQYPAGDMEIQIWAVNSSGAYPLIGNFTSETTISQGEFFTIVGNNSGSSIQLNVPLYKQNNSSWKNIYIGDKTIGAIGCTTTAIAMVYSYHSGNTVYPDAMRYRLDYSNNDLKWSSLSAVGLSSKQYDSNISQSMLSTIYSKLSAGRPVIIGATTSSGKNQHWVVITGYNGTNTSSYSTSDFIINDPGTQNSKTLAEFLANGDKTDRTKIKRIVF